MASNYEDLIARNLAAICRPSEGMDLENRLPATKDGPFYEFRAFGEACRMTPEEITLSGVRQSGPKGLIISLYALHAVPDPLILAPLQSFKDIPGTMPYHGAFTANSERPLIPHVLPVKAACGRIVEAFEGREDAPEASGDFSFLLFPLPKIALGYIFYLPDEDFPASVTCLFSSNAQRFIPLDGLADVAEYTTRRIIERL